MPVLEYFHYSATLVVGVHTPRLDPTPPTVFLAGNIHAEYAAKVRNVLREYHVQQNRSTGLQAYLEQVGGLPLYTVLKLQPAGSARTVDADFNLEVTTLRFNLEFSLNNASLTTDAEKAFAFERQFEQAVRDLFAARSIPSTVIPASNAQLGETFIDIMVEVGPGSEPGLIEVPA